MLGDIEVLRIVKVLIKAILNRIDNTRLQINQKSARNIVLIICLIEKHILSVISLCRIFLQVTFRIDSMLLAKTLPELISN
jgi:hypothetical protein